MRKKNASYVFLLGLTDSSFPDSDRANSYANVWACKLNLVEIMRRFQISSFLVNIFMLIVLSIQHKLLHKGGKL